MKIHFPSIGHALCNMALCAGLIVSLWSLSSCGAEDKYTDEPAFFRFSPVTAVAPLQSALNNPGIWCRVTYNGTYFYFTSSEGISAQYPYSALTTSYAQPQSVAGFVVGTPSVPDLQGQLVPVAYDLACPTCYELNSVQRSLTFDTNERMSCSRCGRVYDLANDGIIVEGEAGEKMLRYRITYSSTQDVVVIQN